MSVTVDLVICTIRADQLQVLLVERGVEPYLGMAALPGGYIREDEHPDDAALRELSEETGLDGSQLHLEQLRVYGAPERDPRGRVITLAYLALGPDLPVPVGGTDARAAFWFPVDSILASRNIELAFDHAQILTEAVEQARSRLEYTTVAAAFCPPEFSVSELRHVYEVVWGTSLDPSNFRRRVTRAENFLEATGQQRQPQLGRPMALYRRGSARLLMPPFLRLPVSGGEIDRRAVSPGQRSGGTTATRLD